MHFGWSLSTNVTSFCQLNDRLPFFSSAFGPLADVVNKHFLLNLRCRNAMCGKVQCTNVDVNNPPTGAQVSIQIVEGSTCVNADFNLGTDVLDPAYVNPGSPCDKGKVSRLWRLGSISRSGHVRERECDQAVMWFNLFQDSSAIVNVEEITTAFNLH